MPACSCVSLTPTKTRVPNDLNNDQHCLPQNG